MTSIEAFRAAASSKTITAQQIDELWAALSEDDRETILCEQGISPEVRAVYNEFLRIVADVNASFKER